ARCAVSSMIAPTTLPLALIPACGPKKLPGWKSAGGVKYSMAEPERKICVVDPEGTYPVMTSNWLNPVTVALSPSKLGTTRTSIEWSAVTDLAGDVANGWLASEQPTTRDTRMHADTRQDIGASGLLKGNGWTRHYSTLSAISFAKVRS